MKQPYRIRNWTEYNAALKQRGSLTFWFSEEVLQEWLYPEPTGALGSPFTFSDIAIETLVVIKSLSHLAGRQATGLVASVFE
jgi:hypothetical protein